MLTIEDIMCRHNSSSRPTAFIEWSRSGVNGPEFWTAVIEHWSGFDVIPHNEFRALFEEYRTDHPVSLTSDLPAELTVYRGQDCDSHIGLAWSTDKAVAEAFAIGHRGIRNSRPTIYTATVRREHVAFRCDDRMENEVVLFEPPMNVVF